MKIASGNRHTISKNVAFIWQITLQLAYDIDTLYAICMHCRYPLHLEVSKKLTFSIVLLN
jgi:hypothetical protein